MKVMGVKSCKQLYLWVECLDNFDALGMDMDWDLLVGYILRMENEDNLEIQWTKPCPVAEKPHELEDDRYLLVFSSFWGGFKKGGKAQVFVFLDLGWRC